MIKVSYIKNWIFSLMLLSSSQLHAENYPFVLSCVGKGTAGNTNMTLNFKNLLIGSGSIDGTSIVFSDDLSGGDSSYNLFGWPRAEDTGNARDIKHKIEISIDRYSGSYSLTVTRIHGLSGVAGKSSGQCERNQGLPKF